MHILDIFHILSVHFHDPGLCYCCIWRRLCRIQSEQQCKSVKLQKQRFETLFNTTVRLVYSSHLSRAVNRSLSLEAEKVLRVPSCELRAWTSSVKRKRRKCDWAATWMAAEIIQSDGFSAELSFFSAGSRKPTTSCRRVGESILKRALRLCDQ